MVKFVVIAIEALTSVFFISLLSPKTLTQTFVPLTLLVLNYTFVPLSLPKYVSST